MKQKLKRINVRISEMEKQQLVAISEVLEVDQSDIVRNAVKKELTAFAETNPKIRKILGKQKPVAA